MHHFFVFLCRLHFFLHFFGAFSHFFACILHLYSLSLRSAQISGSTGSGLWLGSHKPQVFLHLFFFFLEYFLHFFFLHFVDLSAQMSGPEPGSGLGLSSHKPQVFLHLFFMFSESHFSYSSSLHLFDSSAHAHPEQEVSMMQVRQDMPESVQSPGRVGGVSPVASCPHTWVKSMPWRPMVHSGQHDGQATLQSIGLSMLVEAQTPAKASTRNAVSLPDMWRSC